MKVQDIQEKYRKVVTFHSTPLKDDEEDFDEVEKIEKLIIDASEPLQARSDVSVDALIALYYLGALLVIVAGGVLFSRINIWAVFAFSIIASCFADWFGSDLKWNLTARQKLEEAMEKQQNAFIINSCYAKGIIIPYSIWQQV